MTILLLMFLFQFLPKVYHSISLMRRMQKVTGYIFGTIWWGFALNLIAYFIASHVSTSSSVPPSFSYYKGGIFSEFRVWMIFVQVAGGCWYILAIQRVASCLRQQCDNRRNCNLSLSCSDQICYQFMLPADTVGNPCGGAGNSTTAIRKPLCLDVNGTFRYGIYKWALPVVSSQSAAVKILYPIFWGLMSLRYFPFPFLFLI